MSLLLSLLSDGGEGLARENDLEVEGRTWLGGSTVGDQTSMGKGGLGLGGAVARRNRVVWCRESR
jgi:hypothetical protein